MCRDAVAIGATCLLPCNMLAHVAEHVAKHPHVAEPVAMNADVAESVARHAHVAEPVGKLKQALEAEKGLTPHVQQLCG